MKTKMVVVLAMMSAFMQVVFAGPFTVYPGATRMPDRGERANPSHAVMYSTLDAYPKVREYYKKGGEMDNTHPMEGATVFKFDGGGGKERERGSRWRRK